MECAIIFSFLIVISSIIYMFCVWLDGQLSKMQESMERDNQITIIKLYDAEEHITNEKLIKKVA